jgi:transposase
VRLVDWRLYRGRNVVERFWSQAKPYRRVATRSGKRAANFLAFVQVASVMAMPK